MLRKGSARPDKNFGAHHEMPRASARGASLTINPAEASIRLRGCKPRVEFEQRRIVAKIYLVRHAESLANAQGIYQGQTYDTELSVRGNKQTQALVQCFNRIFLSRVIASPLKRTMQTATIVALNKHLPVQVEQQLIETNHGSWEGKHKEIIIKTWPRLYRKWLRFPSSTKFPQGEHFLETQKRVLQWWQMFCQNISTDALVVSHDNIIRIIVARILNRKLNKIWKFHLQPTAITEVNVTEEKITLVSLGDSKHLGGLEVDLSMHAL